MALTCEVVLDTGIRFGEPMLLVDLLQHASNSEPTLTSRNWLMTLRICDDEAIADLHARFFADPTPTDVITFPSGEENDSDESYLGDVVVSAETAATQSTDAGHSTEREVAFLALHGLLHLCGYTDATDEQRDHMHERQYQHLLSWERERGRPW